MTFGEKLSKMRKTTGSTQEDIANCLGVSPQAVSKWENDLSCPDIMLLPQIAKIYGTTVDELLAEDMPKISADINEAKEQCVIDEQKAEKRKLFKNGFVPKFKSNKNVYLKVNVISQNNDDINVKIPFSLLKILGAIKIDKQIAGVSNLGIDFDEIIALVESGAVGEIVNIVSQNGDIIKVNVVTE